MMKNSGNSLKYTLRSLSRLMAYPDAGLRGDLDVIERVLVTERAPRLHSLRALIHDLRESDPYDIEEAYVELFDRSRAASLHLFEHVHGDSRDRGPAMIDLGETYAQGGLMLNEQELPDYLPVVLEFASTQPDRQVREFLGETVHILNAIFSALASRRSAYAEVIAAVIELAGERVETVEVSPEPDLDDAWAEPPAFDGCSTQGQSAPEKPVHIVRKQNLNSTGVRT